MSDEPRTDGGTTVDAAGGKGNLVDRLLEHKNRESVVAVATALGVLLLPMFLIDVLDIVGQVFGLSLSAFSDVLLKILVFSVIVVGFNLLLGYTGLLSFGHAAMFGTGAYFAGLFSNTLSASPILVVFVGLVVGTLIAWPIGFLSIRRSGVYFAVLTLTFGQMLYFFAFGPGAALIRAGGTVFTNGDNGYTPYAGFELTPHLLGSIPLETPVPALTPLFVGDVLTLKYLFIGAFLVLSVIFAHRVMKSPYGLILRGIGENEQRVRFVGLNAFRYKLMAFIISGAFAGLAGGLYAIFKAGLTIHPNDTLLWTVSGDFVIMTTVGGVGTLIGPIVGAGLFEYIAEVVAGLTIAGISFSALWQLMLGLAFVLIVVFTPDGVYGGVQSAFGRLADRFRALPAETEGGETDPGAVSDRGGDD